MTDQKQPEQPQQPQDEVKQADGAQGADAGQQQPPADGSGDVDAKKDEAPAKDEEKAAGKKSSGSKKQQHQPAAGGELPKPAGKPVLVKSLVNMICPDGTQMVKGKVVELSQDEIARQKQDARGPFHEAVK
jgi:hypothetical protein